MRLLLNGEEREFDAPLTVQELLDRVGIDSRKVAVEQNFGIVVKSEYSSTVVSDGDKLEIVHFIGGG